MRVGEGFDRLVNILAVINTHCPFLECLYCLLGSSTHGRIRVRFFNDARFIRDNSSLVSEIVEHNDCALKGNFGGILCADLIQDFFLAFIPIFVAIDPIALVAIFIGLGTSASHERRQRQAFLGIFTALCVAVGFIFLGKIIFSALGITVADFQVAGGLILLGLAGRELLGLGPHDRGGSDEFGVVPLGMPLIAGPAL